MGNAEFRVEELSQNAEADCHESCADNARYSLVKILAAQLQSFPAIHWPKPGNKNEKLEAFVSVSEMSPKCYWQTLRQVRNVRFASGKFSRDQMRIFDRDRAYLLK